MSSLLYDSICKNKTDKAHLEFKLHVLDLESKFDRKMRQSDRLKFRQKYGLDEDLFGPWNTKQTCICSFLREKNGCGQQRECDTSVSAAEIYDYQTLMELLFTDGELDTEKLMCLHTLAFHPFETLKQSHKARVSYIAGQDLRESDPTALDKLIERSRLKRGYKNGATNFLPIYVLNLNHKMNNSSKRCNQKWYSNEGRPATRIAINENITLLVSTIVDALKSCNPTKMKYLLSLVQNPCLIIKIINKPEHQDFLSTLSELSIIISSNSFRLSKPYIHYVTLTIQEPVQCLQYLIKKIRTSITNYSTVFNHQIGSNESNQHNKMVSKRNTLSPLEKDILNADDNSSYLNVMSYRTKGFNAEAVSRIITNKVREAFQRDMKELKKSTKNELCKTASLTSQNALTSKLLEVDKDKSETKLLEKENKSKKQSSVNKSLSKNPISATNSTVSEFQANFNKNTQRLNRMIREEEENIYRPLIHFEKTSHSFTKETTVQKPMIFSKENKKPAYLQKKTKKYINNFGYKPIETQNFLNNLNLAKLRHEVSVIENNRRVKMFLEAPLFQKNTYS